MLAVRALLAHHRLALLLCVAALLLKLLVPAGYMLDRTGGTLAISICSGVAAPAAAHDMPGMHGDMASYARRQEAPADHGKPELPCAFAGLSAAALAAIDPVQLAALIAFVVASGVAAVALPSPLAPTYLRPPSRGPPVVLRS